MTTQVLTYDSFQPGSFLGEWESRIDASLLSGWQEIFGNDDADAPARIAGIVVIGMMRSYLEVVQPRPPGNIHTRQKLSLKRLPQAGETIRSGVWCQDKHQKRGRNYLYLEVSGKDSDDQLIYTGQMSLIWAA